MTIIRVEENGIEFFTDAATGESGLSVSGLALLCGADKSTISRLLTRCVESEEIGLEQWVSQDLNLLREASYVKDGGEVKILKAAFCADVIMYYAFKGNKIAQSSLRKFSEAGITVWIHRITGYV